MSSLRNSVKRKTHKERAQPVERRKLGLLEKHKDYVLRAKDFHRKEDTLKDLRLKASFRNPDEFYFKMENSRTKGGVHIQPTLSGAKALTEEQLSLMRSQDRGYILIKLQAERKKVEKLQAALHGVTEAAEEDKGTEKKAAPIAKWKLLRMQKEKERLGGGHQEEEEGEGVSVLWKKHIVFEAVDEEGEDGGEGGEGGQGEREERLSGAGEGPEEKELKGSTQPQTRSKRMAAAYQELELRKERVSSLSAIIQQMELQKAIAGKGRKRKITVETEGRAVQVYKWAKQRQR